MFLKCNCGIATKRSVYVGSSRKYQTVLLLTYSSKYVQTKQLSYQQLFGGVLDDRHTQSAIVVKRKHQRKMMHSTVFVTKIFRLVVSYLFLLVWINVVSGGKHLFLDI